MLRSGRLMMLVAAAAGLVLVPHTAARAHGGVRPTLHHDGAGSVWVTAVWLDGHPVTEPILATLAGHSDSGEAFSATALQPLSHQQATAIRPGVLAAGKWSLTLDVAAPGLGYCQADIVVGPGAAPGKVSCDTDPAPQTETAQTPSARFPWLLAIAATFGLAAALLGRQYRRSRRTPAAARTSRPVAGAGRKARR